MGTVVRFRNQSGIQYIDTLRQLADHTVFYTSKLPKTVTFTLKNPLCQYALDACCNAVRGNAVFVQSDKDYELRRSYLMAAYSCLDSLEELLHVAAIRYYHSISNKEKEDDESKDGDEKPESFPWREWGRLIFEARNLLKQVMKSDSTRHKSRKEEG